MINYSNQQGKFVTVGQTYSVFIHLLSFVTTCNRL